MFDQNWQPCFSGTQNKMLHGILHNVAVISLLLVTALQPYIYGTASQNSDYTVEETEVDFSDEKPVKIFTSAELKKYDGTIDSKPILMSIKGIVFDVSSGRNFYGKDAPYNLLVGKDSTKAVAKMSLDPNDLTHDISDLSSSQLKALDDVIEGTYLKKYPIVGYMDYLVKNNPEKFANVKMTKSEL